MVFKLMNKSDKDILNKTLDINMYQNNKIFRCYTECNEAMSIFTLYEKFMYINYHSCEMKSRNRCRKRYDSSIVVLLKLC